MTSDELLLAAWERRWREPSEGWDVTEHARGVWTADPPWSYDDLADEALAGAGSVVDLGTGGGEWLLGRPHLPSETHATEGWPPNLPVARRALEPRGVAVAACDADAGVSAMVGFLRIMPWQLPEGWTVRGHAAPLLDLHRRHSAGEPLTFTERRFVLRARRPAGDGPEGWPARGRIGT